MVLASQSITLVTSISFQSSLLASLVVRTAFNYERSLAAIASGNAPSFGFVTWRRAHQYYQRKQKKKTEISNVLSNQLTR